MHTLKNLRIAGFSKESIVDGEGYRYVIFVQGCNHKCPGCQNPETWDFDAGTVYDEAKLKEILNEISEDPIIDGVTLSGGDPFYQAAACVELVKAIKNLRPELNIWAYTGFVWDELIKDPDRLELVKCCDVIVDGPFILGKRSLDVLFRGSTNQRLIDVKKTLEVGNITLFNES